MPENILFVCSANKERSKTAEDYFSSLYPTINFLSAGTNLKLCEKEGTNPLSEEMILWADRIFVMEEKHRKFIKEYSANKYAHKITVLSIEDIYKYYQKELIEILVEKMENYWE